MLSPQSVSLANLVVPSETFNYNFLLIDILELNSLVTNHMNEKFCKSNRIGS